MNIEEIKWSLNHAECISPSPEIIRELIQRVEYLQQWEPAFCTQSNCKHKAHALESSHVSELIRKIQKLERKVEAYREVARKIAMENGPTDLRDWIDSEVERILKEKK